MILAKWALVLVIFTNPDCVGSGCVPTISQSVTPVESKELCLQQANYLAAEARKLTFTRGYYSIGARAHCIQVAK